MDINNYCKSSQSPLNSESRCGPFVGIAEDIHLDNVSSVSMVDVDFVVLEMEDVYLQITVNYCYHNVPMLNSMLLFKSFYEK